MDSAVRLWAQQQKCVSCHTHGIYMIARPALSTHWGKPPEDIRDFVVAQAQALKRDNTMSGSTPVQFGYIARGLAEWDSRFRKTTSTETDAVLRYLFELQADDGSLRVKDRWPPLISSSWHGTVMAAMAVADAPGWQAGIEDTGLLAKIDKLNRFLRETPPKNDHERVLLLWASTRVPELLDPNERDEIVARIWKHQRPDGGWSICTFATPENLGGGRRALRLAEDPYFLKAPSDGYQTGLAVVVLRDAGVPSSHPGIQKAVNWLLSGQRQSGRWWTRSLNADSRFHFISYSGTAYAALALAKCDAMPALPR